MKILFLDIDGCLNSVRSCVAYHSASESNGYGRIDNPKLDPIAVLLLQKIIEETGAKIVISSTWRKLYPLSDFNPMFKKFYNWDAPIIDKTPILHRIRGLEIEDWLSNHPEVTSYVILDDDSDMTKEQLANNFVKCDADIGISFDNFQHAIKILGKINNEN